ncbi:MAG: agmatinase [Phycisphaerae bacterium]|nr:agmatinase [Phycisphaerae bacterium]
MHDSVPDNFLGLPPPRNGLRGAKVAVLPIPYDATTSYAVGTRDGPRAIITASQQVELYDEGLGRETITDGIVTLDPVTPDVSGPKATLDAIYRAAAPVVRAGKFLLSLGGEHSISSGLVRAVAEKHKKLSVLQIDAHADLRDEYQGSPFSHAAVMRRIHDMGVPAVAVGIRNYSRDEATFIRKAKKPIFSAAWCRETPDWIERVLEPLTDNVYVTIDIDGFDPAFAPGTGTPEPGGMDWFQVTKLLARLAETRRIVSADIVEVRPIPPNHVTEFLAARLAHRLLGLAVR